MAALDFVAAVASAAEAGAVAECDADFDGESEDDAGAEANAECDAGFSFRAFDVPGEGSLPVFTSDLARFLGCVADPTSSLVN